MTHEETSIIPTGDHCHEAAYGVIGLDQDYRPGRDMGQI